MRDTTCRDAIFHKKGVSTDLCFESVCARLLKHLHGLYAKPAIHSNGLEHPLVVLVEGAHVLVNKLGDTNNLLERETATAERKREKLCHDRVCERE